MQRPICRQMRRCRTTFVAKGVTFRSILLAFTPRGSMTARRQEEMVGPPPPLLPEVESDLASSPYGELRRLAAAKMHFERGDHTLQPTALVHEAYLRLTDWAMARAWLRQQLSPIK